VSRWRRADQKMVVSRPQQQCLPNCPSRCPCTASRPTAHCHNTSSFLNTAKVGTSWKSNYRHDELLSVAQNVAACLGAPIQLHIQKVELLCFLITILTSFFQQHSRVFRPFNARRDKRPINAILAVALFHLPGFDSPLVWDQGKFFCGSHKDD
jgi:hypothetical protein